MTPEEQLLDYRRVVAGMYARVRDHRMAAAARCEQFRRERDELFCTHPQSALSTEQQTGFSGLRYYPYDPAYRFVLPVEPDTAPTNVEIALKHDGVLQMRCFGKIHFALSGQVVSLNLYSILGYGGGIFLPFGDSTNGVETYGGGRYLLDTIKHADLGHEESGLVVDFNFAYNPSCAYNERWFCPLSPPENRLPMPVPVGEKAYSNA